MVGARVRAERRASGLSLAALAAAAGIGKGSLSEIENGVRNPTLGTLYAIADALGLPLATLLDGRPGTRIAAAGIAASLLDVTGGEHGTVEVYRLQLGAGARHRSAPHGHGVVEHLLVTSGRAAVGRAGEEVELATGESASWVSDVPHTYTALDDVPVQAVLVIRSPHRSGSGGRP
ncbi:transcriptional regulator [Mycobacterium decipiens]|uniref:Transcriptional regulator n=2 Tax=Mycobacterium decipiens TaxID=1430326 RepID=A0A1X2M0Z2_9MYCO|nr:transcriptional regulator [Mycobacterium decipiens]